MDARSKRYHFGSWRSYRHEMKAFIRTAKLDGVDIHCT
jgi:hypothetical protein